MITTKPGAKILREAILRILQERGPRTAREIRAELWVRGHSGAPVPTRAALRVLEAAGDVARFHDVWHVVGSRT